jgi:3',5'-cyclic AMP phosphodiesterase CpdA
VAYGDTRTNAEAHAAVLAQIAKFQPDFILQTGDLVENGTNEAQWAVFFNTAAKVLAHTPYFPALGNHERNGAPYFKYFDAPRDYSFDYGNAHFAVLDSNRPPAELAEQDEWLKKDLAAHQNATWRFVAFHHTPYTCVDIPARRIAAEVLRQRLEPIFLAGKVQLVINGHDHTYQHHFANGIHYVVTGGGGAPLYKIKLDTSFTKTAKSAHHDCEITIDGKTLALRAVEPDGTEIEKFQITTP